MIFSEDASFATFSEEITWFVMNQLRGLREKSPPQPTEMEAYFQHVGKAATVFAIMHQSHVVLTMEKLEGKLMNSYHFFDVFVNAFADQYFQSIDTLPRESFFVALLAFCGVIADVSDFCFQRGRINLVQACFCNLEMELELCRDDFNDLGSWDAFHKAAVPFVKLYESRTWEREEDI